MLRQALGGTVTAGEFGSRKREIDRRENVSWIDQRNEGAGDRTHMTNRKTKKGNSGEKKMRKRSEGKRNMRSIGEGRGK